MNTITTTFERHGITYATTGTLGAPQIIVVQASQMNVPLSGPLFFAAADAIALAARAQGAAPKPQPVQPAPAADVDTMAKALDRLKKLLRMTADNGATQAEAANAAARAQEIIDRYKLSMAQAMTDDAAPVQSDEPIEHFKHDPLNPQDTQLARWKSWLCIELCKANQTKCYVSGGRLILIGRASDVMVVRYMFTWICGEIERLASRDCRGCGITYWNNYRLGCVETVTKRLKEQHTATLEKVRLEAGAVSSTALALVNHNAALIVKRAEEVEEWASQERNLGFKLQKRSSSRSRFDSNARARGRAAGASINLNASGRIGGGASRRLA